MVYTPNALEDDMGGNPMSSYYIITRRKQGPFLIQRMPELCSTMGGYKRTPAYQFITRMRDYKPHLKDALVVSSTASTDVGIITRSDQPLGSDDNAKQAVGTFAMTEVDDDTKKASVPLNDSAEETSAIGLGIDLSSSENVLSPIPGETIDESSTPLPNILLLNNDGILSSWWFIYADSIRQKLPYQGLVSVSESQPQQPQPKPQPQPQQPGFGQPSFGGPPTLGASSGLGKASLPSFGSPSALGGGGPSFGAPSLGGGPSFGTPSQPGSGFGAPSQLGRGAPHFGKPGLGAMGSSFGQPSTMGQGPGSLGFGASSAASGGGFGAFAKPGGFSGFGAAKPSGESPFSKPAVENPFGQPAKPSPFGSTDTATAFTSQQTSESKGQLGFESGGFKLGSTFKGDGTAATDAPKPEKPSTFSFGGTLDEMLTSPNKPSTPMDAGEDMEPEPAAAQPEKPAAPEPTPQPEAPSKPDISAPSGPMPGLFGAQAQPEKAPAAQPAKPGFSLFGNAPAEKQVTSPVSPPSEKTTIASTTPKQKPIDAVEPPSVTAEEAPLPPDPTTKAVYGPGDTSASSNVSKSSVEEAPLPPDFVTAPKPVSKEAKEPPAELPKGAEEPELPKVVPEAAPLPPDPGVSKAKAATEAEPGPVPDESGADEFGKEADEINEEEEAGESDEEEADESENEPEEGDSDFADSGEEITHDAAQEEAELQSPKATPESSFGGASDRGPAVSLFNRTSKREQGQKQPGQLFGEITKPGLPAPDQAKAERGSPSSAGAPARGRHQRTKSGGRGKTLAAFKASGIARKAQQPSRRGISPEDTRLRLQAQRQEEEEELALSDDDEDEKLRADLALPLEPVPTLDPFLPHQDYMGETSKPGIPGQIERLYRDINSMVDTLGINARSLASYILYQQSSEGTGFEKWMDMLQGDNPTSVLEEDLRLTQIEKLDDALAVLDRSLQEHKVDGVDEKLEHCRELLSKDILTLRSQCAGIQKILDAHTDTVAIRSASLSAEQANLQQDLRSASTSIQAKLVDLEQGVSLLRAKIAEIPRPDGGDGTRHAWKRPTMEQVTSTIATMMNMTENKSSDIDVLEVQLRRLGIDGATPPSRREGSPYTTPKKSGVKFAATPGSSDGRVSTYHTPESARGANFRSSISGSAKASRFRGVGELGDVVTREDTERWKSKTQRRKYLVGGLKKAIGEKKSKVRGMDDL